VGEWFSGKTDAEDKYGAIGVWDVSKITDMEALFKAKTTFDEDISDWDTSAVTTMEQMFQSARDQRRRGGPLGTSWDHVLISPGPSCRNIKPLGRCIQPAHRRLGHVRGHVDGADVRLRAIPAPRRRSSGDFLEQRVDLPWPIMPSNP
jgi:hypothetical protein